MCQASVQSLDISTWQLGACRVNHNCPETIPAGGHLQRRQDLPADAFFVPSEEDLAGVRVVFRRFVFIALSYRWLTKGSLRGVTVRSSSWPHSIRFSHRSLAIACAACNMRSSCGGHSARDRVFLRIQERERVVCKPIDVREDDVLQFCGISACARVHISTEYFQITHMRCMSLACLEHLPT